MSLVFFATSTNAQNLNRNAVKAEVPAQMSLALAQPAQKGGVKKLADNQGLLGFTGSDGANGFGWGGFPTWSSASMVISDLDISEVASELKGCKVVGFRFAVTGSLGDGASALALIFKGKNDQNGTELGADLTDYDVSVVSDDQQSVDVAWNEVSFDQPYEITGEETEVMYGYAYTQVKSQTDKNAAPVLFGRPPPLGAPGPGPLPIPLLFGAAATRPAYRFFRLASRSALVTLILPPPLLPRWTDFRSGSYRSRCMPHRSLKAPHGFRDR